MTFSEIGLNDEILKAITDLGFEEPTPIQQESIPFVLSEETDLIALAQTGTGKTAAFGLPVIQKIDFGKTQTQSIILCPTRELCLQITKDLEIERINIYSIEGKLIKTFETTKFNLETNGIYFIKIISTDGKTSIRKVVIQ